MNSHLDFEASFRTSKNCSDIVALVMAGVDVVFIEHLAEALCGLSAVLFTFIATFSRSEKAEYMVQNIIAGSLILCAVVLWWLALAGCSLWGSEYLPKPLSLVCIIIAISARMNIRGTNVSFGANPHSIGKKEEE